MTVKEVERKIYPFMSISSTEYIYITDSHNCFTKCITDECMAWEFHKEYSINEQDQKGPMLPREEKQDRCRRFD